MKEYLFELYVLSLDGYSKSFVSYVRLNSDEAIVNDNGCILVTDAGWRKMSVDDREYYRLHLMTSIDRINRMSEIDYRIQQLQDERRQLEFNADEALFLEEEYKEDIGDYMCK